ncbi:AraC family transcriptional regulator [Burkholderia sp. AU45388]|uniref:helix-turn-helix domain-containing protein n=1 Tax=Burkholderia sp. AU45388 TaxID=3059206 RepID=UPI00265654E6|nr:helix-turn-helix transcriptional regulator [Burkholderia sp. AU45388]MDN7431426.1 helix-turn-helix transcriptional regulator [Burkholderia sp. AU45388]
MLCLKLFIDKSQHCTSHYTLLYPQRRRSNAPEVYHRPMDSLRRPPVPALQGLIESIWAHDPFPLVDRRFAAREHVLPTGATHIALRVGGPSLRVFDNTADLCGRHLGHAVVGGARAAYHLRDVSQPSISVGAVLRPGATSALLGVPEVALAGRHTPLELLLQSGEIDDLLSRLQACPNATSRLALFERWLLARGRGRSPTLHPALTGVLGHSDRWFTRVSEIVDACGLSHRHCIALFRQATGLAPHEWLRLQRFARALTLATDGSRGWAEIAAASGFADQAHLANSFRSITGVAPSVWRHRTDPATPRHMPA